ncbi:hypothetical protein BDV41DRAFT_534614 [Aspergillus transmontanensis]|uniref:Uncharacterized protein n=1 Tax=Aspergillus transmontanensis TaxID=1034304 RepID=A0A5N6W2V1_9EURO|nr:hypothetical protein BDV41DRAFT_534614 [Aspergillus transmontanensis]
MPFASSQSRARLMRSWSTHVLYDFSSFLFVTTVRYFISLCRGARLVNFYSSSISPDPFHISSAM